MHHLDTPGAPIWVDFGFNDLPAHTDLLTRLLGWEFGDANEEMGGYTQATAGGNAVAGMMAAEPGTDDGTTVYLNAPDIAVIVARAKELGATAIPLGAEGDEIAQAGEFGAMAIVVDPTGAAFGLWQSGTHHGFDEMHGEPGVGQPCWFSVYSPDPDATAAFYTDLFGFEINKPEWADGRIAGKGDSQFFDIAAGDEPLWRPYYVVADLEATMAVNAEAGGTSVGEVDEMPFGRALDINLPGGAPLGIFAE